jgi:putative oxidoreductase
MTALNRSIVPAVIARPANRISALATASDLGPLLIRVMIGVVFAFHGAQKLFGWFGGYGIEGTARAFESLGIPFPTLNVYLAGGAEFFGGLFLIIGLLTRPWALILTFTMIVAVLTAHRSAFSLQHNGMEYALTLGVVSLALAFIGAGRISLDRTLNLPAA